MLTWFAARGYLAFFLLLSKVYSTAFPVTFQNCLPCSFHFKTLLYGSRQCSFSENTSIFWLYMNSYMPPGVSILKVLADFAQTTLLINRRNKDEGMCITVHFSIAKTKTKQNKQTNKQNKTKQNQPPPQKKQIIGTAPLSVLSGCCQLLHLPTCVLYCPVHTCLISREGLT